jgi:hypothetical protein
MINLIMLLTLITSCAPMNRYIYVTNIPMSALGPRSSDDYIDWSASQMKLLRKSNYMCLSNESMIIGSRFNKISKNFKSYYNIQDENKLINFDKLVKDFPPSDCNFFNTIRYDIIFKSPIHIDELYGNSNPFMRKYGIFEKNFTIATIELGDFGEKENTYNYVSLYYPQKYIYKKNDVDMFATLLQIKNGKDCCTVKLVELK